MRRNAIVSLAVLIVVLGLGALVGVPAYVSSGIEDDLTRDGGRAHVKVKAFPPFSLLDGEGDSIEITASGLKLAIPRDQNAALDGLEGYKEVHADLRDVRTGPFKVHRVRIDRASANAPYAVELEATAQPKDLGGYTVARWGDSFIGDLISRVEGDVTTSSTDPVTLGIKARVERSQEGGAQLVVVSGGVDGLDRDAIARALTSAVLARL